MRSAIPVSYTHLDVYKRQIPEDVLALLKERGVLDRFDGGVASCEVHINKPDPRIYQALSLIHIFTSPCLQLQQRSRQHASPGLRPSGSG